MSRRDIEELQRAIKRIEQQPQSAARERDKARMEFDLRVKQAEREVIVAKRARLLFDAFWQNGAMRSMLPDGRRTEYVGSPHHVSDIQKVWNARGEADKLADWSEA